MLSRHAAQGYHLVPSQHRTAPKQRALWGSALGAAIAALSCSSSSPSVEPFVGEPNPGGDSTEQSTDEPGNEQNGMPEAESPPAPSISLLGRPEHSRLVRLTHAQWENSVQDLLGLEAPSGLSEGFTGDPPEGKFSNNERALFISPNLRLDYQRAAEALAEQVTRDPEALNRLAPGEDPAAFVRALGRRAYRRPLSEEEATRYDQLFASAASILESGNAFADGAQLVLEALLQSPHFLFRSELGSAGEPLSAYEVATKLSFLLRDRAPSDELLNEAEAGSFDSPEGIRAMAEQMLDGSPALLALASYHRQLFGIDRYLSIAKDPERFPNFSEDLNPQLARAEELFLEHLVEQNLGLQELLTSTTAFVNQATQAIYGLSGFGEEFEEVDLGGDRPGLFTRIGFLAYNGTLRDPDSIHRGVEINREVLCTQLLPPAGVIPALPTIEPGQTNRERVNAHTGPGTCGAGCHATLINPIGFAFESFDALGQYRETDNGKPVDTAGIYRFNDGEKAFADAPELMTLIAQSPQAHACYAKHLAEFALGREIDQADRAFIYELQEQSRNGDASIQEALLSIVTSPAFTHRSEETL